ncbi:MAG: bifunctional precorrin-2 dehydrogenase/sirohydrochlorin ferrochelatase [Magnetococcales bacterium]|nr:bifunctional precorrin-2 dehydrogenase/sirohydrochlorin ferrochelatase [Magnetococcales bacterium]
MAELSLKNRLVLVFGGGDVAKRKIRGLLPCQPQLIIIAPTFDSWILDKAKEGVLNIEQHPFEAKMLSKEPRPTLVFSATSEATLNKQIANQCEALGILCNSADDPTVSGFLVPAVVRQHPITLAVATGGHSPALSRLLKERLTHCLEPGWPALVNLFGMMRGEVKNTLTHAKQRHKFWRQLALDVVHEKRYLSTDNQAWFDEKLSHSIKEWNELRTNKTADSDK